MIVALQIVQNTDVQALQMTCRWALDIEIVVRTPSLQAF